MQHRHSLHGECRLVLHVVPRLHVEPRPTSVAGFVFSVRHRHVLRAMPRLRAAPSVCGPLTTSFVIRVFLCVFRFLRQGRDGKRCKLAASSMDEFDTTPAARARRAK